MDAIEFGHDCCRKIIAGIRELQSKAGKPKRAYHTAAVDQELYAKIAADVRADLTDAMDTAKYRKIDSYHRVAELKKRVSRRCRRREAVASRPVTSIG